MAMSEANDLNEAMGGGDVAETPAPAKKPAGRPQKIKASTKKPPSRLSKAPTDVDFSNLKSGDRCPMCEHGRIMIVRTVRRMASNFRRRIWGCKNNDCRQIVRVEDTPISPSRQMTTTPQPAIKPGARWS